MKIKIVTWNMAYWSHKNLLSEVWDYFLNEIDADFYFFQEARPSKKIRDDKEHLVWNAIGGNRPWGSGIYSRKDKLNEEIIKTEFKGVFSIANTIIEDKKLTLISLYGLMESNGPTKGYAITNLHKMLSDLTCIFNGHIDGKRSIVLGGDLNASIQWDQMQKNNSHKIFFDRLEDFNLNDCFKLSNKEFSVQTLRHPNSKINWQNDYFFISKKLSKKILNCEIIDNDKNRKYSDHNPVIITLEI
jgi:exodeoxyribonuclease-3